MQLLAVELEAEAGRVRQGDVPAERGRMGGGLEVVGRGARGGAAVGCEGCARPSSGSGSLVKTAPKLGSILSPFSDIIMNSQHGMWPNAIAM